MESQSDVVPDTTEPTTQNYPARAPWLTVRERTDDSPFCLDQAFLDSYVGRQPVWGPIGYVVYKRTYARALETVSKRHQKLAADAGLKVSEEWWLTTARVVEGCYRLQQQHCHQLHIPWYAEKAQHSAQEMYRLIFEFKFLPPGRGLWMMGTDYVQKAGGAALNNCAFVSTNEIHVNFSAPFTFLMDMSMLGVGVGGDTRGAGTITLQEPEIDSITRHVVSDDREGWVGLVRRVIDSFVGRATFPAFIDYSEVRPAGALIKGFGGTAAGPDPLKELVEGIKHILGRRVNQPIKSTDIVDLFNMIGRCVVAGNVRRSAEIMFGEPTDDDFLELKNYHKHPNECAQWRWASNNSIWGQVGMDYSDVAERTALNGEPGYEWLENARNYGRMGRNPDYADTAAMGGNPCLEQTLESFELCCLVETFPSLHDSYEEYERTLKFAYLYAKSVTLVPTHDPRTNAVLLRNRRIGCSQSGIVASMNRHGRREHFEWCDRGYHALHERDEQYSRWLCVPRSIKMTSVKPSGTVSKLCGVPPGIHYPHSEYYFNVVRMPVDSHMVECLQKANYRCVDLRPREPNTMAVYFPVHEQHFVRGKDDVTMWEQLENAAQMQQYWADNQVSVTVTFKRTKRAKDMPWLTDMIERGEMDPDTVIVKGEEGDIKNALELYETRLKGVSFLPASEHGYHHAPYQTITKEEYETYSAQLLPLDLTFQGNEIVDKFCDGDGCTLPPPSVPKPTNGNSNGSNHP